MMIASIFALLLSHSAQTSAIPEYCALGASEQSAGIHFDSSTDSQFGVQHLVSCTYSSAGALISLEHNFRILCPQGAALVLPGYAMPAGSAKWQSVAGMIPGVSSDGRNFVDIDVVEANSSVPLAITVYALCK